MTPAPPLHELEAVLLGDARPPAILIHGARRMGKSSILCQLPRLLGPGFAPGTVDCQNPAVSGGAPALFAALSRTLAECLARRGVSVEPLTRAALTPDPFSLFDDWLRGVERAMPDPLRALLCFDEYEALHPGVTDGWGSALLDYLRHLQQHRSKFVLVFAGVRPFHALGREWTSRFVSTRATRVSFLSPEELRPLLERPVPRFNLRYQGESLDLLLRLTGGQPLLTQVVAFELVSQLNLERRHDASPADVLAAASNALQSAEGYFANVWDDAEPDGRARLWEAVQGRPVPAGPTRTRLREMDVVNDQGNIAVPLLAQWVSQLGNSIAWEREPGAGSVSEFLPA